MDFTFKDFEHERLQLEENFCLIYMYFLSGVYEHYFDSDFVTLLFYFTNLFN